MKLTDFKRIARVLKEAYEEVQKETLSAGITPAGDKYSELLSKVREEVVTRAGFTVEDYIQAKETYLKVKKDPGNLVSFVETVEGRIMKKVGERLDKQDKTLSAIVTREDVEYIARDVFESTPPQVVERVVEKIVQPIKETVINREEYDDSILKEELEGSKSELRGYVEKTLDSHKDDVLENVEEKLSERTEALKKEFEDYIAQSFKKNIDIMGMPDFRKLAMGLQAQLDELSSGGTFWLNGTPGAKNTLTVSSTEPTNPTLNDLWVDTA
jgi:hypothetical protein